MIVKQFPNPITCESLKKVLNTAVIESDGKSSDNDDWNKPKLRARYRRIIVEQFLRFDVAFRFDNWDELTSILVKMFELNYVPIQRRMHFFTGKIWRNVACNP